MVVPAHREGDGISPTLDSIQTAFPEWWTVVVINASTTEDALASNLQTLAVCESEPRVLVVDRFRRAHVDGVGAARRVGMDVAIASLQQAPSRWIVSLDADTTISGDYGFQLRELGDDVSLALAAYEHPLTNDAIVDYELWLRLRTHGLRWARSPFAFTALGSRFAVRASAYAAVSGMPPRKAGEDFHFMNKVAKTFGPETIAELRDVVVHPSDRASDRVPFGTGPAVAESVPKEIGPIEAFRDLKTLHQGVADGLRLAALPTSIVEFLGDDIKTLRRIDQETENRSEQFVRRFYQSFDGLKERRFLNWTEGKKGRSSREDAVHTFTQCDPNLSSRSLLLKLRAETF